jgi:hypothetical protein
MEQRFGTQRLLFGTFRTWWSNLIESGLLSTEELLRLQSGGVLPGVVGNLSQYANVASIDNYGWNGAWEGSALEGRARFGLNAVGAFTRLNTGGQSSPPVAAPQLFGNAHFSWCPGGHLPTVSLAVSAMGPRPADRTAPDGSLLPAAPPTADLHAALTGRVPKVPWLSYVLTGDYVTASHGPYTAGPSFPYAISSLFLSQGAVMPSPGFAPVDQLRVVVGFRLDLWTRSSSSGGGAP